MTRDIEKRIARLELEAEKSAEKLEAYKVFAPLDNVITRLLERLDAKEGGNYAAKYRAAQNALRFAPATPAKEICNAAFEKVWKEFEQFVIVLYDIVDYSAPDLVEELNAALEAITANIRTGAD